MLAHGAASEERSAIAPQSPTDRFDHDATLRIEGEVTTINAAASIGLACLELLVFREGEISQRWSVECGDETKQDVTERLKPGDRVIVTGAPARKPATPRMVIESLLRPSDGLTWRAHSG